MTLLVPELINKIKQENPLMDLPNLALAFSKAVVEDLPNSNNTLEILAELSNLSNFNSNARAALHLLGIGEKPDSWVCYGSPVLIQPNRDHLSIAQAEGFELDANEAKHFCAEFNDYFKDEGLHYRFVQPDKWFCFSKRVNDAAVYSPAQIVGKNLLEFLPPEISDIQWRKVFNETQMLLHHSATNQQRISNGKAEINSLWFWGGGKLADSCCLTFNQVLTNNPEIKGIAKLGQTLSNNLPENIHSDLLIEGNEHLFVIDFQYSADVYPLIDQYVQECLELLKDKSISTIQIVPEYGQKYILTSKDLKKFWKRSRALSTFL